MAIDINAERAKYGLPPLNQPSGSSNMAPNAPVSTPTIDIEAERAKYGLAPLKAPEPKYTLEDVQEKVVKKVLPKKKRSILDKVEDFGKGVGASLGEFAVGVTQLPVKGAKYITKKVGGNTQDLDKIDAGLQKLKETAFTKPAEEARQTGSGKAGSIVGDVVPYLIPGGAGTKIAATGAEATAKAFIPRVTKKVVQKVVTPNVIKDATIAAAQTQDEKAAAATGVTTAVSDIILGNKGKALKGFQGYLKRILPGYVSDVAQGVAGQRGEDREGVKALIPGGGTVFTGALATAVPAIKGIKKAVTPTPVEEIITKRAKEIENIENNYAKTRKAIKYSNDGNAESRRRIAQTDVLVDSINEDGMVQTKQKGGAVDQYKEQTIKGKEGTVRLDLEREGAKVGPDEVKAYLKKEILASGLEGKALNTALRNVDGEVAGLMRRAGPDGKIQLVNVHDAKISSTNGIDYNTEPHVKTERKAVANAYRTLIEDKSKLNIKEVNAELAKYYKDIELLENLDGKRVRGGKVGRYFAKISGNIVGGTVGAAMGGPVGAAVGTMAGGEIAGRIKSNVLSKTFGKATGGRAAQSEVLDKAVERSKSPRLALPAPREGTPNKSNYVPIPLKAPASVENRAGSVRTQPVYDNRKALPPASGKPEFGSTDTIQLPSTLRETRGIDAPAEQIGEGYLNNTGVLNTNQSIPTIPSNNSITPNVDSYLPKVKDKVGVVAGAANPNKTVEKAIVMSKQIMTDPGTAAYVEANGGVGALIASTRDHIVESLIREGKKSLAQKIAALDISVIQDLDDLSASIAVLIPKNSLPKSK